MARTALVVALLCALAGCASPGPALDNAGARPTLVLVDGNDIDPDSAWSEDDKLWGPERVCIRLTNNDQQTMTVSSADFYLLDGDRVVHHPGLASSIILEEIPPRAVLEGCLRFAMDSADPAPYTLVFSDADVSVRLPDRPPSTPAYGVGDWINGTHVNIRLVDAHRWTTSVDEYGQADVEHTLTNVTLEFKFHNGSTPVRFVWPHGPVATAGPDHFVTVATCCRSGDITTPLVDAHGAFTGIVQVLPDGPETAVAWYVGTGF